MTIITNLIKSISGLLSLLRSSDIRTTIYGHGRFREWGDWRATGLIHQVFDATGDASHTMLTSVMMLTSVLCSRPPKPGDTIRFRWQGRTTRARVMRVDSHSLVKRVYIDAGLATAFVAACPEMDNPLKRHDIPQEGSRYVFYHQWLCSKTLLNLPSFRHGVVSTHANV